MVAVAYEYEMVWIGLLMLVAWPLYISQLLALRFTPKRKLVSVKLCMLVCGLITLTAASVRLVDPSAVYGRFTPSVGFFLGTQSTSGLFYAAACWILTLAKSLYLQIQHTLPRALGPALYASVGLYQFSLTLLVLVQSQMLARPTQYSEMAAMRMCILMDVVLIAEVLFLLSVAWLLFLNLRVKIAAFIASLTQHEQVRVDHLFKQQSSPMLQGPGAPSPLLRKVLAGAMVGGGLPHAPSEASELSATSSVSSHRRGDREHEPLQPLQLPPPAQEAGDKQTVHTAIAAVAGAAAATPAATADSTHQTSSPTFNSAHAVPAECPPGTAPVEPRHGYTPSARVHPAPVCQPAPQGRGSILLVDVPSSGVASFTNGTLRGRRRSSASQERLHELAAALRKMTRMTAILTVLCLGGIAASIPRLRRGLEGKIAELDIHGADPDSYDPNRLIPISLHLFATLVITWFVWTNPSNWMRAAVRRERQTPFWATLRHGAPDIEVIPLALDKRVAAAAAIAAAGADPASRSARLPAPPSPQQQPMQADPSLASIKRAQTSVQQAHVMRAPRPLPRVRAPSTSTNAAESANIRKAWSLEQAPTDRPGSAAADSAIV